MLPLDITQRGSCHHPRNLIVSRGKNVTTCFLWALCLDVMPDIFNILINERSIQILSRLQRMEKPKKAISENIESESRAEQTTTENHLIVVQTKS